MDYFKIIFLIIIISKGNLFAQNIKIEKTYEHPFLIDHGRVAKSLDKSGKTLDSIQISSHTGAASYISLFEIDSALILIDVNGMWYYISQKTGKFYHGFWGWQKDFPEKYIGTYSYSSLNRKYILKKTEINKKNVYQLKDPTDYSGRFRKRKKYPPRGLKIIEDKSTKITNSELNKNRK